jgi:diguanylate cyclase (GGDEF)-like protein
MRTSDVVGRYGGDEFVIILENTDEHAVEAARDRVCDVLAEPVFVEDGTEMPVRGSVGIAVDDGSGGLDELLARADAAMYRSKARRR